MGARHYIGRQPKTSRPPIYWPPPSVLLALLSNALVNCWMARMRHAPCDQLELVGRCRRTVAEKQVNCCYAWTIQPGTPRRPSERYPPRQMRAENGDQAIPRLTILGQRSGLPSIKVALMHEASKPKTSRQRCCWSGRPPTNRARFCDAIHALPIQCCARYPRELHGEVCTDDLCLIFASEC